MNDTVVVMGVGMVPFTKPGKGETYDVMAAAAARQAVADAGVDYRAVETDGAARAATLLAELI